MIQKTPRIDHHLMICNAYASAVGLHIIHVRSAQQLTLDKPLNYKDCGEFTVPLEEDDQLDFKAGDHDIGTFSTTGLPKVPTSLLLVAHRRTRNSMAMKFESHAFAPLQSPQLAVIDAYRGDEQGSVKIVDLNADSEQDSDEKMVLTQAASEGLSYNSVVAINPGRYNIELMSGTGKNITSVPVSLIGHSNYVALRLGSGDKHDATKTGRPSFPQELIVYPRSDAQLRSQVAIAAFIVAFVFLAFEL